jgi:single-stranded DNA-binding protein
MADLNTISIGGNLVDMPSVYPATGPHGVKMARFKVACHRMIRDSSQPSGWGEVTDVFTVVCWGKLADRAERQLSTGAYVNVAGRSQTYPMERRITAPQSGETVSIVVTGYEIAADNLKMIIPGREPSQANAPDDQSDECEANQLQALDEALA